MKAGHSHAPPDEPDPTLGKVIRRLREENGLSQNELAERAEISVSTLTQIEDGTTDPPWATVERIAEGLGVSMREFTSEVLQQERAEGTS